MTGNKKKHCKGDNVGGEGKTTQSGRSQKKGLKDGKERWGNLGGIVRETFEEGA